MVVDRHNSDKAPTSPWVQIDQAVLRHNLTEMAEYAAAHGLKLRPHIKTHKLIEVAKSQVELGAVGLTVSTTAEAIAMAEVCDDILLANPVVDPRQLDTLAWLAGRATLRVAIDSIEAAKRWSLAATSSGHAIHLLVELDVGVARTGTQSPERCASLAQSIIELPGLSLDGIMIYPGHVPGPASEKQGETLESVNQVLDAALSLWQQHGLEPSIVSGGSTPTALHSHRIEGLTEIRPGTYAFNDMNCVKAGVTTPGRCAATIRSTVISNSVPNQVVIDAGSKTLSSDLCGPAPDTGHGFVVEYPGAVIRKLYEEHGLIDVSGCETIPDVGDVLTIIPNHICPCINLQERVWLTQGNTQQPPLASQAVEGRR